MSIVENHDSQKLPKIMLFSSSTGKPTHSLAVTKFPSTKEDPTISLTLNEKKKTNKTDDKTATKFSKRKGGKGSYIYSLVTHSGKKYKQGINASISDE